MYGPFSNAGPDGMERELPLHDPSPEDLYHLSAVDRVEKGIEALPRDLFDAVKCARESDLLREAQGTKVIDKLVETKIDEYDGYRLHVSNRELEERPKL